MQFNLPTGTVHLQPYMGWNATAGSQPASGSSRFFRWRQFIGTPVNLIGNDGPWGTKVLIVGEGNPSRMICQEKDNGLASDNLTLMCGLGIFDPPNATARLPLSAGSWHDIQVELRSGSAGIVRVYIDNNNQASPTGASGTMNLNPQGWQGFGLGYYNGTTLRPGSHVDIRFADAEVGTAFDPNWDR